MRKLAAAPDRPLHDDEGSLTLAPGWPPASPQPATENPHGNTRERLTNGTALTVKCQDSRSSEIGIRRQVRRNPQITALSDYGIVCAGRRGVRWERFPLVLPARGGPWVKAPLFSNPVHGLHGHACAVAGTGREPGRRLRARPLVVLRGRPRRRPLTCRHGADGGGRRRRRECPDRRRRARRRRAHPLCQVPVPRRGSPGPGARVLRCLPPSRRGNAPPEGATGSRACPGRSSWCVWSWRWSPCRSADGPPAPGASAPPSVLIASFAGLRHLQNCRIYRARDRLTIRHT